MHTEAFKWLLNVPAGQLVHALAPDNEYVPLRHWFSFRSLHPCAPWYSTYHPAEQFLHVLCPFWSLNVPARQSVHAALPSSEYFPCPQDSQLSCVVDSSVSEYLPAGHFRQFSSDADSLVLLQVPRGQSVHADSPLVAVYFATSQILHESTDSALGSGLNFPALHGSHSDFPPVAYVPASQTKQS